MLSCNSDDIPGPPKNRGPEARITVASAVLLEGSEIAFDASTSSDLDGDTLAYRWTLGDGITRTAAAVARIYVDDGEYAVSVIVTDQHGASDTATVRVSVKNVPPALDTLMMPGDTRVGAATAIRVLAHDVGITDSLTVLVDWKDGSTSTRKYDHPAQEISVAHTYATPGTYAVEVTVQDDDGGITKHVADRPIIIVPPGANLRPTAVITRYPPNDPIFERASVTFNGITSSDPDGDSLTYRWDVGDGLNRTGSNTARTFWDDGSWDVTLIVTDTHGASDTARTRITVLNVAPVVGGIITPSGAILPGTSTSIQVWAVDSGVTDSLTMQVDWKDGDTTTLQFEKGSFFNQVIAHTYSKVGSYLVSVSVRDKDGGESSRAIEKPIVVVGPHTNHPPVARITGPDSGREGTGVVFSAATSTDPDGDSLTVTFLSGDGRTHKEYPRYGNARTYQSGWSYADNGTYIVSLIVADDSGAADTASMPVAIVNAPPQLQWWATPTQAAAGAPASIQVLIADQGASDRHSITVDWGDGVSDTFAAADTGTWPLCYECGPVHAAETGFHTYAATGTYSITVTAKDDDGGTSNSITTASPVRVFNANNRQSVGGYEATDLGTLGGNAARPEDINDRGQVVGISLTGTWDDRAFLWDASGMHDLGAMGHEGSEAIRINESGVIAGTVWTRITGMHSHNQASVNIGTTWESGVPRALDSTQVILLSGDHGPYCAGVFFSAVTPRIVRAMNSSGEIVWVSYDRSCTDGWLWQNGSWKQLPAMPLAMNDRGQVVGASLIGDYPWYWHAFVAEGGTTRDLGVLAPWMCNPGQDCSMSEATDINESGQVVGISTDAAGRYHYVLWQDDKIKDLGVADWVFPQIVPHVVINDRGEIAGSAAGKGFFWSADSMIALPSGGGSVTVVAVNESGEVTGTIQTGAEQHAFVWSLARGMVDLGTGPDGFSGAWVVDINARGDIVGYTGPCKVSAGRCADNTRNPGSLQWTQVRAVLWRKN